MAISPQEAESRRKEKISKLIMELEGEIEQQLGDSYVPGKPFTYSPSRKISEPLDRIDPDKNVDFTRDCVKVVVDRYEERGWSVKYNPSFDSGNGRFKLVLTARG